MKIHIDKGTYWPEEIKVIINTDKFIKIQYYVDDSLVTVCAFSTYGNLLEEIKSKYNLTTGKKK